MEAFHGKGSSRLVERRRDCLIIEGSTCFDGSSRDLECAVSLRPSVHAFLRPGSPTPQGLTRKSVSTESTVVVCFRAFGTRADDQRRAGASFRLDSSVPGGFSSARCASPALAMAEPRCRLAPAPALALARARNLCLWRTSTDRTSPADGIFPPRLNSRGPYFKSYPSK